MHTSFLLSIQRKQRKQREDHDIFSFVFGVQANTDMEEILSYQVLQLPGNIASRIKQSYETMKSYQVEEKLRQESRLPWVNVGCVVHDGYNANGMPGCKTAVMTVSKIQ